MTPEQLEMLKSHGVKVVSNLNKFDNKDAFKEKADEMYELLCIHGLPIIENGKIIGTRFPPDENGYVKEIYKIKNIN